MATTVFQDTFTEASTTALASHTPDIGTSWEEFEDSIPSTVQVNAAADNVSPAASGAAGTRIIYAATPTIALGSADYDVKATLVSISSASHMFGVLGRISGSGPTDAGDFYAGMVVVASANPDAWIIKRVGGVYTSLGTANTGPVSGDIYTLQMRGSTIDLLKNDVSIISVSDSAITGVGKGGIGWGDFLNDGVKLPSASRTLDDFFIIDQTAVVADTGLPRSVKSRPFPFTTGSAGVRSVK